MSYSRTIICYCSNINQEIREIYKRLIVSILVVVQNVGYLVDEIECAFFDMLSVDRSCLRVVVMMRGVVKVGMDEDT